MNQNQPEAAMNALRLSLNVIRSATDAPEDVRTKLERRVQSELMAIAQAEERIVAERAERTRLDAAAEQRTRTIDLLQRDKQTIEAMMIQFDLLIKEGVYNVLYSGGMGNIVTTSAPFGEARLLAQQAYALNRGGPLPYSDNDPSPGAGYFVSYTMGFYSQEIQFRALTKYRFLLTMQDITRASVPFPDTPDDRIPRRRLVACDLRKADPEVRESRRPVRTRRKDQANSREARRADLDVVQRGNAARRRAQVHQAGDDHGELFGAFRSTSTRSGFQKPTRRWPRPVRNMELEGVPSEAHAQAAAQPARPDLHGQGRVPDDHLQRV